MNEQIYRMHMEVLAGQCAVIAELPIVEMLNTIENYESFGCFVMNPISWSQGLKDAAEQKELLEAALKLQRVALKIRGDRPPVSQAFKELREAVGDKLNGADPDVVGE
jgi:hypothetical protein